MLRQNLLTPGWKSLENEGGGPCLFRSAADHIFLKDFKLFRKYVSQHVVDNCFFFIVIIFPFLYLSKLVQEMQATGNLSEMSNLILILLRVMNPCIHGTPLTLK